jgi:carboxyl-terminal processing protease
VFRKDESRTFPVTITREEITVQSVKVKLLDSGYAWVRVNQFQDRTVEDFARKVGDLYKQDPEDQGLRARPAQRPGRPARGRRRHRGAFLPADSVVVKTNGQIQDSKQTFKAEPETTSAAAARSAQAPADIAQVRAARSS